MGLLEDLPYACIHCGKIKYHSNMDVIEFCCGYRMIRDERKNYNQPLEFVWQDQLSKSINNFVVQDNAAMDRMWFTVPACNDGNTINPIKKDNTMNPLTEVEKMIIDSMSLNDEYIDTITEMLLTSRQLHRTNLAENYANFRAARKMVEDYLDS